MMGTGRIAAILGAVLILFMAFFAVFGGSGDSEEQASQSGGEMEQGADEETRSAAAGDENTQPNDTSAASAEATEAAEQAAESGEMAAQEAEDTARQAAEEQGAVGAVGTEPQAGTGEDAEQSRDEDIAALSEEPTGRVEGASGGSGGVSAADENPMDLDSALEAVENSQVAEEVKSGLRDAVQAAEATPEAFRAAVEEIRTAMNDDGSGAAGAPSSAPTGDDEMELGMDLEEMWTKTVDALDASELSEEVKAAFNSAIDAAQETPDAFRDMIEELRTALNVDADGGAATAQE